MQKVKIKWLASLFVVGFFSPTTVISSELTIPNEFSSGEVTSASEMNANFAAIKAAVDDNHARIAEGAQSESRAVFVGFSADSVIGTSGLSAINQACYNLLPDSRICTDIELTLSPYNPDLPIPEGSAFIVVDSTANSLVTTNFVSCGVAGRGAIVANGRVRQDEGFCAYDLPVACCK